MYNTWFLRTDRDGAHFLDISEDHTFIYSLHGICGNPDIIRAHKSKLFPALNLTENGLRRLIFKLKKELIANGLFDPSEKGKRRCDLAIRYWLSTMKVGDVVFARNRKGQVLICKITDYISEDFFDANCCFQRPVQILGYLKNEPPFDKIWKRTTGRKTLERNAQAQIASLVTKLVESL